ncbi:MAG: HAMP domain-containing histidine kinase [Planctomycetes bacterium]|nr:HAMP domain-containing histidine kinase [Planctomycetota bacterium]
MLVATLALTLLGVLAFGAWVFAAAPGRPENRAFAAFCGLAALWVTNDLAFFGLGGDPGPWARAAFLVALALQLAFLRFTHVFPAPVVACRLELALALGPGLVLVPVVLAGAPLAGVTVDGGAVEVRTNGWTFALGAWSYGLFALAWLRLLAARRATADPRLRRQLDLLLMADGVTGALTTLACVVLPLVAGSSALLPWTSVAILMGTLVHGHAVLAWGFLRPASPLDEVQRFPVSARLSLAALLAWASGLLLVVAALRAGGVVAGPWAEALAVSAVAAALPTLGLVLAAQALVVAPLRRVSEAALRVTKGELDARAGLPPRGDEVGVLARAFDGMVERLARDLDAQRERAELLARTERLAVAGTLAAGVAHEVNNPLAAVSSLVQLARERSEDAAQRALLDDAVTQMERVAGALRGLMDLARPRAPTRAPCRLDEVVAATLRLLAHDPRLRRVRVRADVAPGTPPVEGDPDQLQQVLLNLLLNARDAVDGQPDARVTVSLAHDAARGEVELCVRDSGPGVPEAARERVFEPFYSTKAPGHGTGLGLAVTRDLVRAHGGRLELDGRPGDTTFRVRLKAAQEVAG